RKATRDPLEAQSACDYAVAKFTVQPLNAENSMSKNDDRPTAAAQSKAVAEGKGAVPYG
ncbi:unnamed protein product, partial [Amoebophrya sp. A25]